jgi:DNA-binding transcriptional ArsR family regulator
MKKGKAIVRNVDERRLRALMMLEHKIKNGVSNAHVAKEFGVSEKTVDRTLSWARKAGLVVKAEDKILQELVPLAHQAIKTALEKGDSDVALEIFKGMLPSFNKKQGPAPGGGNSRDELSSYIETLRAGLGVIEGEVAGSSAERTLPAGSTPTVEGVLLLTDGERAPDDAQGAATSVARSSPSATESN